MNRYFDIALNLASDRFSGERDKVIADALIHNVNYFNIVCSSLNELDFVKDLLYTTGVAITPGVDFDENRGNKTIRFSYARSHNDIKEGLIKIKKFMKLKGYIN